MNRKMIAPCGMNCGICLGFLREKNRCRGCRSGGRGKPTYCNKCVIANCPELKKSKEKYCSSQCAKFPCRRLKQLDKRYKTNYGMSMIENLEYIQDKGIIKFVANEKRRWTCKKCNGTICVHRSFCLNCGNKVTKNMYN
ncbi:DUF3795 domain-containing protein [Patescibacteria group bacterium]|nr:DUF3795 domain-containing protein [Patescibacteria group bacterium]